MKMTLEKALIIMRIIEESGIGPEEVSMLDEGGALLEFLKSFAGRIVDGPVANKHTRMAIQLEEGEVVFHLFGYGVRVKSADALFNFEENNLRPGTVQDATALSRARPEYLKEGPIVLLGSPHPGATDFQVATHNSQGEGYVYRQQKEPEEFWPDNFRFLAVSKNVRDTTDDCAMIDLSMVRRALKEREGKSK